MGKTKDGEFPRIDWRTPDPAPFHAVFEEIKDDIAQGMYQKSVPVISEYGVLQEGSWASVLGRLERLPAALFCYGYQFGGSGCLGATPELLLAKHGTRLETMALAGTAKAGEVEAFEEDPKEISEHEYVANYLCKKLADLGEVRREPRQALKLGRIAHLLTAIHVQLEQPNDLNDLIRYLHPTPALGTLPREVAT
ncbi:MAG: chorismate-binding protein, partial [Verrucomicrobiota bacterium]